MTNINRRKLNALLQWYSQEVGNQIIVVLVVNREGFVLESLKGHSIKAFDQELINSINSVLKLVLKRIEEDYRLGGFGAGTFDTAQYRFIFMKAGDDQILITVLNPLTVVDNVFPYAFIAAEKVARIFDGRTVSPVIPKMYTSEAERVIERKIGTFQTIKTHSNEYAYKMILGGDGAVGKTSMVHRFVEGEFQTDYKATIGTSIMKKQCEFEGLESSVRLILWDLAGQDQFQNVRQSYIHAAEAGFIVYDITRRKTFENIIKWRDEIISFSKTKIKLILIGNKKDLEENRKVSTYEGQELARELGLSFMETSAKTGDQIEDAFRIMALQLIKGHIMSADAYDIKEQKEKPLLIEEPKIEVAKTVDLEEGLSPIEKKRLDFWNELIDKIQIFSLKVPLLKDGMTFTYVISDEWAGAELNFYHDNPAVNQRRFKELESKKAEIEEKFNSIAWHYSTKWQWDFEKNRNHQRILYKFENMGLNEEYRWNHLTTLIVDGMRCFVASLESYLDDLD